MSSIIIRGMHCQHCVASVSKAMGQVPGAGEVSVDLEAGKAEWTGPAAAADMAAAVNAQGFEAKEA